MKENTNGFLFRDGGIKETHRECEGDSHEIVEQFLMK